MALTTAQLTTLKADIDGDPTLSAFPNNPDGNTAIAGLYNTDASPDFWVFRTQLDKHTVYSNTALDTDGVTVTSWDWTLYSGLNAGEQGAWVEMFNETGIQDPSLPNVRAAWADIFSGPQAGPVAQRAHLSAMARRLATRVEQLFATGTGTAVDPGTMVVESPISFRDVSAARDLP